MSFVANPLALSVPEPAFEAWLRDSSYLEILDTSSSSLPTSSAFFPSSSNPLPPKTAAAAVAGVLFSVFFFLRTLASLFTINPFAKLTPEDFAGETPSWTLGFVGNAGSYTWPGGPAQARMRVQENVRRYARNYAFLCLIFFACSLCACVLISLLFFQSTYFSFSSAFSYPYFDLQVSDANSAIEFVGKFGSLGAAEVLQ